MRLISYNIEYCEGTTHGVWEYLNAAHALRSPKGLDKRMASFLANQDPDILGLVEVDEGSFRSRERDETAFFADRLGLSNIVKTQKYRGGWRRALKLLPILKHQDNAVLTKHEVKSATFHELSKGFKNVVIEVTLSEPSVHTVLLVHLALFRGTRRTQLLELRRLVNDINTPILLCGDFNTFSSEELNYLLEETRLRDAYSGREGFTQPSWNPTHRLDNVLVTNDVDVTDYRVLDAHFSDHLPVQVDYEVTQ